MEVMKLLPEIGAAFVTILLFPLIWRLSWFLSTAWIKGMTLVIKDIIKMWKDLK